ncbi:helix-turn-helix transcriptional regulator [Nocardia cyriacigeorgica]|uniref:helix-turn-helix transcriptional regulator n=1 Tax=Nocardia cyriacigeorgica TaxID=135487 RepID=UPI001895969F|nr:YafY family protein [Nocardia cyriacigeorgica]MBF6161569.1 YafY family transcriptional regulator [Nocardia cyriacigeorgica]MBF6200367.1 YafY family transcriptional regulator [Nocardia cyriacigeorgica]
MRETSARLLRLLSLLQMHREWTGTGLAAELGIDIRTVRRDIDKLRDLGYPVEAARGVAGYRLGAGTELPPLLLDDDEAVAVAIGLRTAAGGTISGIEDSSLRALTKLEQMLPSRLRHRVRTLLAATVSVGAGGPTVDPDVLTAIAGAIRDKHRLRFDYRSHDGTTTVRLTEPHRLAHTGRRWYLVAWDVDRVDWRTFRVDRLQPRTPTGPRFTPREAPDIDLAGYVSSNVSVAPYRYTARVTIGVPADSAADHVPPTIGVIEPIDAESCLLHTGSNSLDELAIYLALFDLPIRIDEPPELIARVRELTARLSAAVE